MMKSPMKISRSRIVNPWPSQKRKAYKTVIEWDLKTYKAMKMEIEAEIVAIEEMVAPSATDIRENIFIVPRSHRPKARQEGDLPTYIHGKTTRVNYSDPTANKAEQIRRYRSQLLSGTEFKEMVRRVNAIERVLERLDSSPTVERRLRAELVKSKYFEQEETDDQIMARLNVSKTTYYTWIQKTIYEIAKELGIII